MKAVDALACYAIHVLLRHVLVRLEARRPALTARDAAEIAGLAAQIYREAAARAPVTQRRGRR